MALVTFRAIRASSVVAYGIRDLVRRSLGPRRGLSVSVLRDQVNHRAKVPVVAAGTGAGLFARDVEERHEAVRRGDRHDIQIAGRLRIAMKRHSVPDIQRQRRAIAGVEIDALRLPARGYRNAVDN